MPERKVTTSPGCAAATDGLHEWHWFTVPAHIRNGKTVRPSYQRALCWKCDAEERMTP